VTSRTRPRSHRIGPVVGFVGPLAQLLGDGWLRHGERAQPSGQAAQKVNIFRPIMHGLLVP